MCNWRYKSGKIYTKRLKRQQESVCKNDILLTIELYSKQYNYIQEFAYANIPYEQEMLYTEKLLKFMQKSK